MTDIPSMSEIAERFEQKYIDKHTPWDRTDVPPELVRFMDDVTERSLEPAILDIGCGTGWTCRYFADRGCTVLGVDSSQTAIDAALFAGTHEGNIEYLCQDGITFLEAYDGRTFDAVCDRGFLHHVPEKYWETYFAGMDRLLLADGLFYISCFSESAVKKGFDPKKEEKSWNAVVEPNGYKTYDHFFTVDSLKEIFGDRYTLVWQEKDAISKKNGSVLYHTLFQKK